MSNSDLTFYFEFASTYSYLSAMRIEEAAAERGVALVWKPLLLGPIFAAQGWSSSPFNLYPMKGRYMWRDMERATARMGLAFRQPDPFPQNGLLAARLTIVADREGFAPDFVKAVYHAEFANGMDISEKETMIAVLESLGRDDAGDLVAATQDDAVKQALKANVSDAQEIGIFGAPSFVASDGELFWGNDRLDEALEWAATAE